MHHILKYLFVLSLLDIFLVACSRGHTTIVVTVDSVTGIKKRVEVQNIGKGSGITGSGPELTRITIRKYDSNGKEIYVSHRNIQRDGCFSTTGKWEIISVEPNGTTNSFSLDHDIGLIKVLDKNQQLLSEEKIRLKDLTKLSWFDSEEMKVH